MNQQNPITSMRRTQFALDEYDSNSTPTNAVKCAEAYAKDTAAFNNPETCMLLHPGPATPSLGYPLSFMRKIVQAWRKYNSQLL